MSSIAKGESCPKNSDVFFLISLFGLLPFHLSEKCCCRPWWAKGNCAAKDEQKIIPTRLNVNSDEDELNVNSDANFMNGQIVDFAMNRGREYHVKSSLILIYFRNCIITISIWRKRETRLADILQWFNLFLVCATNWIQLHRAKLFRHHFCFTSTMRKRS